MKLHIFNPEHDIALAANLANFTAPYAGRTLRKDLGFLPAIWADERDAILVDEKDDARQRWMDCMERNGLKGREPHWVELRELRNLHPDCVEPWGWDLSLRAQLLRYGIEEEIIPRVDEIEDIRHLSHRIHAAEILQSLKSIPGTVGEAYSCHTIDEIEEMVARYHHVVLKAPWSSSGRGVRFVKDVLDTSLRRWAERVILTQGDMMVEPYYDKVEDFAMEFFSDGAGNIDYQGLSVFSTIHGAYTGNVLATENEKQRRLSRYISVSVLQEVQKCICHHAALLFQHRYAGPFGVDMMVVKGTATDAYLLHPCVEMNVRRTMGHVALALSKYETMLRHVVRVSLTQRYELNIEIDDNEKHHDGNGA